MTTYRVCCFRRRFRPLSNEPSEAIGDVFQAYSGGGGVLSEEALRRFLREVQGEAGDEDLEESAREVMAFAAEQKVLKKGGGGLTVEGFHRWLCSDANAAIHPRRGMNSSNDDSDDEFDMLIMLAATLAENEKVPYAPRRDPPLISGIQWVEARLKDPKRFYKSFRMRRSVFRMLHAILVARYGLMSTIQMSSVESLALFLWMLGGPATNSQAADRFERSVSTVSNKFHHVLDCVDRMAGDYIRPNDPTFTQVHDKLTKPRFWPHFKDAIGAIDGTHIPVIVAEKDRQIYTNRKGYTSQNVMAICDFDMRFTFAVAGWAGSVHDTRVWTDARPHFPNYPHPPTGKYYLVDSGYPNRVGYLAPFKEQRYHVPEFQGAPPQNMMERFNHLHSCLRNAIERAFGILKMKWRILQGIPHFHEALTQTKIITACMCLHNFIRDSNLYDEHFDQFERCPYVHEDSASVTGGPNPSSSDSFMASLRQSIAESIIA